MFNNKGMTLIEIIIAIAIIGIISIGILSGFSTGFSMIIKGRGLTEDTFSVQKEVERAIEDMKKDIEDGSAPTPQSITLFSGDLQRTVEYHPLNKSLASGIDVSVFVTKRLIQFPLYDISNVKVEFNNGGSYAYIDQSPPLFARQKNEPTINDPDSVRAAEIYRWYVSRPGFNLPIHEGSFPEEIQMGSLWPGMSDFIEIKTGLSSQYKQLTNMELQNFAGRHIIHTVTPGTVHGRTGTEVISNYLYISGLPYSKDLKVHLDASYINVDNKDEFDINVKKWNNISEPSYNATSISAPNLGIAEENNSYWRFLEGNGSNMVINNSIGNTQEMTFFMAGKFNNTHTDKKIIGNNRWGVGWSSNGQLEFHLKDNTGKTYSAETSIYVEPNEWYVLTGIVDSSGVSFKIARSESMADNSGFTPMNFSLGPINLEWFEGMNLAEVLIYDKALNGQNRAKVEQYLISKYNPPEQSIKIDYLENQTRNVFVGDNFTMPFVTARMSNGATQVVPVNWNPSKIDTSVVGQVTAIGTAVSDPTKTMTLTVNILPLEQFTVKFVNYDGTELKEQQVYRGQSATPPEVPERVGFKFTGWDKPYNNITSNITVTAQYEEKYLVRFVDFDNSLIKEEYVEKGGTATPPDNPHRAAHTFMSWDKTFSNVQGNLTIRPVYRDDLEGTVEWLRNETQHEQGWVSNSNHSRTLDRNNNEFGTTISWTVSNNVGDIINQGGELRLKFPNSDRELTGELTGTVSKDGQTKVVKFNVTTRRTTRWFIVTWREYSYSISPK